jgi:phage shock protein PspC (stress-responsive transcriptional regulator)
VSKVVFNKSSKSLIIRFSTKRLTLETLLAGMMEKVPRLVVRSGFRRKPLNDNPAECDYSEYVKAFYGLLEDGNRQIFSVTGGLADFYSLAPSLVFAMAVLSFITNPFAPRWHDYFWYAVNFQYWHHREMRNGQLVQSGRRPSQVVRGKADEGRE